MSSEIVVENGIGETRAAVVEDGRITELHVERAGSYLRAGDIWNARLGKLLVAGRRGIVSIGDSEALIEPVPAGVTEGGRLRVKVVREAMPERGRPRLPKVQAIDGQPTDGGRVTAGPDLLERLRALRRPLRFVKPHEPDLLEQAGWSEAVEEATTGIAPFEGGLLTISPTPAMTVIDVDGALPAAELALAGAKAAALAIRRHGIAGSIGIDLPTVPEKSVRQAAAAMIDTHLPPPFERTAVNGFGFIQIVRPRLRASMIELVQNDPVATAALALLRRAEREPGRGERTLVAPAGVTAWLESRRDLLDELRRRTGASVRLQASAALPISGGYVDIRSR